MYSKFKNVRLLTFLAHGDYSLYCKKTGAYSFSNYRKAFQQNKAKKDPKTLEKEIGTNGTEPTSTKYKKCQYHAAASKPT